MISGASAGTPAAAEKEAHRLMRAGLLTAAASHEVKNLILAIRAQAQVGLMLEDPDSARDSLESILRATHDMGGWFNSLLDFATGNGQRTNRFELSEALDQTLDLLGPLLRQGRVTVAREYLPVRSFRGKCSPYRQVFFNVLLNAWEAMRSTGGILTVRVRPNGGRVETEVRDTGPGLPEGIGDRIFEPFATERNSGSGLGLYVARSIVTELGGTIRADSLPAGGARFRIRF